MLSEHEGFGVPLIEAMTHGLPVVAYDAGAVGEILGDTGVLLEKKHPRHVAAAIHRLLADPTEVARLTTRGRERVEAMDLPNAGNRLVAAVRALADRVPVSGEIGVAG
jgi:glycosyltransferase involved in cell wall biosynthesis